MAKRRSVMDIWSEMRKSDFAYGTSGLVLGGVAAVGAVVLGLYLSRSLFPESSPEARVTQTPAEPETDRSATAPATTTDPADPAPETAAPAVDPRTSDADAASAEETEGQGPEEGAPEPVAPEPVAPAFDIVRVSPDGQTLVAGRAPGAREVTVLVDGQEMGRAEVDGSGKFVAFLDLPDSTDPRVVNLVSEGEAGRIESDDQVILAPVAGVAEAPLPAEDVPVAEVAEPDGPVNTAALPENGAADQTAVEPALDMAPADIADADPTLPRDRDPVTQQEAPDVTTALSQPNVAAPQSAAPEVPVPGSRVVAPESPDAPSAPAVILSTEAGVNVLQPGGTPAQPLDQIALDAITYEDAGDVALSGRGTATEFVRIYLDNQPIQTTRVGTDGQWRAELPDVDTGTYTLRVDAVDSTGTVTSRVESPFRREDPVALSEAAQLSGGRSVIQLVTVQPGNTLWAIARDRYGEGLAYVKVFEANRDSIRDPDLIYPGQVFSIPE